MKQTTQVSGVFEFDEREICHMNGGNGGEMHAICMHAHIGMSQAHATLVNSTKEICQPSASALDAMTRLAETPSKLPLLPKHAPKASAHASGRSDTPSTSRRQHTSAYVKRFAPKASAHASGRRDTPSPRRKRIIVEYLKLVVEYLRLVVEYLEHPNASAHASGRRDIPSPRTPT